MLVAINQTAQTLEAGQSLTFDLFRKTGCSEYAYNGAIYLKGNGLYLVDFSGNISGTAPLQLAIAFNGTPMQEGVMNASPSAEANLTNVSRSIAINTTTNCCFKLGTGSVTIVNNGTNAVTVAAGSSLRIGRVG